MIRERTLLARGLDQVRQVFCGLHGHDALLHFEAGRMSLLCTSCGHETPGWDVRGDPTKQRTVTAADHSLPRRLSLLAERRIC